MDITNIEVSEYCLGIPLKGWDSVKAALQAYSDGKGRGARTTTNRHLDSVDQGPNGGMAVALTLYAGILLGKPDAFVERVLAEAEQVLKSHSQWHGSWDYDAMGTNFFKTSVDIELRDKKEEIYVLSINAVYVGDEPEKGLADHLGVPRTLLRHMITVTAKPLNSTHFEFDFNEIYDGLGPLLGLEAYVGTKIAQHMMSGDQFDGPGRFVLKEDADLRVTLSLGRVERRFTFKHGKVTADNWKADGSVLTGLLADSYNDHGTKEPPTFVITVSKKPEEKNQFGDSPVWDAELRQKMATLADEIGKGMFNGWP